MMCCRKDGKLLKPSVPAMYIDRVWQGDASVGESSVAMTVINNESWRYVSIINNTKFNLYPSDIGINPFLKTRHVAFFWCDERP